MCFTAHHTQFRYSCSVRVLSKRLIPYKYQLQIIAFRIRFHVGHRTVCRKLLYHLRQLCFFLAYRRRTAFLLLLLFFLHFFIDRITFRSSGSFRHLYSLLTACRQQHNPHKRHSTNTSTHHTSRFNLFINIYSLLLFLILLKDGVFPDLFTYRNSYYPHYNL